MRPVSHVSYVVIGRCINTTLHHLFKMPWRPTTITFLNIFFAFLSVVGQVGQNVTLPLWTGSSQLDCSVNASAAANSSSMSMDPFFVLSFASLTFVIIFGIISLVLAIFSAVGPGPLCQGGPNSVCKEFAVTRDDLKFPQWQLILIGFFDALNGIMVVFASLPDRTAPFLQAILGNFLIPLTIFFRMILLFKKPTGLKFTCALVVLVGLIFSLIPIITGTEGDSGHAWQSQPIAARVLWPLCFMFGFVPAALMNVIEEKSLKDSRNVNLFYLLFCTSSYQLITVWLLFWTDLIPSFGFAEGAHQFGQNYWFALKCFFGHADCGYTPGLRGAVFIVMYALSYIGGGLLLRYAEGATFLAIVQSLVTPLGALFWSVFDYNSCGRFFWHPHADKLTYFSIAGLVLIVPSIFLYNIGTVDNLLKMFGCKKGNGSNIQTDNSSKIKETTPLIKSDGSVPRTVY